MRLLIRTALMGVAIVLGGGLGLLLRTNELLVVEAQSPPPCVTPNPSGNGQWGSWAPNQDVIVNINPQDFHPWEIDCLKAAFANWNANNGPNGNNSGIYFRVYASSDPVAVMDPNHQSVSTTQEPSFQVNRGHR